MLQLHLPSLPSLSFTSLFPTLKLRPTTYPLFLAYTKLPSLSLPLNRARVTSIQLTPAETAQKKNPCPPIAISEIFRSPGP